jgi:hypothetical protein
MVVLTEREKTDVADADVASATLYRIKLYCFLKFIVHELNSEMV